MGQEELGILLSAIIDKTESERKINQVVKQIKAEAVKLDIEIDDKVIKSEATNFYKQQSADMKKLETEKTAFLKKEEEKRDKITRDNLAKQQILLQRQRKFMNEIAALNGFQAKANTMGASPIGLGKVQSLIDEIDNTSVFNKLPLDEQIAKYKELDRAIASVNKQFKAMGQEKNLGNKLAKETKQTQAASIQVERLTLRLEKYINANKRLNGTTYGDQAQQLLGELKSGKYGKNNLPEAEKQMASIQRGAYSAGLEGENMWEKIKGAYVKFGGWALVTSSMTMLVRTFKDIVNVVKETDKAMVNLQMVTGGTRAETSKLIKQYSQMAKELGATTIEVSTSANEFLRQGLSIEQTNKMIEASMVLSKVGMLGSAEAAQYLTAAYKGFKVSADDVMSIVDKVSAVDLVSATSAGGLMEAQARVANFASQVGFSMDRLLGTIATIGEVTQRDMGSVGDSIKTILARMSNIKLGRLIDDETGESLSDVETALGLVNIKLRDSSTEFRNYTDVLDETAGKWDNFSGVQKNAVATAFAGKNRIEDFIVLMNNYGNVLEFSEASLNSAGTAMEKFGAYQEGAEANAAKMKASFESLSQTLLSGEFISGFLKIGTTAINVLDWIIDKLGVLPTVIGAVTIAMTAMGKSVGRANKIDVPH